jgi:hypothetical protein
MGPDDVENGVSVKIRDCKWTKISPVNINWRNLMTSTIERKCNNSF